MLGLGVAKDFPFLCEDSNDDTFMGSIDKSGKKWENSGLSITFEPSKLNMEFLEKDGYKN